MNSHDIDIELPPLPYPQMPGNDYTVSDMKDYARAAIKADRKRRKPQHIDPELKAAIEDAATTRSPVAITKDGRGVMLNYGDEEDRMAEHEDNACAYCGGSGHKGDVADRQRRGEPVAWRWQWKDLPDSGWQLSSVGGWRETDAIKSEPLYLAPIAPQPALDAADLAFIADELRQAGKNRAADLVLTAMAYPTQPAEPVKLQSDDERAAQGLPPYNPRLPTDEEMKRLTENGRKAWGKDDTEPVKVPSDDAIDVLKLALEYWADRQQRYRNRAPVWVQEARALLARYGSKS